MIGQRAEILKSRPSIHDYGCYMMSIIRMAWEYCPPNEIITTEAILEFHDWALNNNAMGPECYVIDPQRMVDYWVPDRLKFLGKEAADYEVRLDQTAIQLWTYDRPEGGVWKHFCWGNFDPWLRSITKAKGKVDSIRLFEEM